MANETKEAEPKGEQKVEVYRVLRPVVLTSDRNEYQPGAIVDLSHLPDKSIQHFLKKKVFELAEGEPANVPQPIGDGRAPRPCCN